VTEVGVQLSGRVLRLDLRRRVATVALPSVGQGRTFAADYADEGGGLARVVEWLHGTPGARSVGAVVAVRPGESGTEVDLCITGGDTAWQRIASGDARVGVQCAFAYTDGPDPRGGRVERVDIG
jgi:hypothetical protein